MDLTQITSTTWRGLSLPVLVALNCHQQPYILPHVRIVDMPQDLRRHIEFWATSIRSEPMPKPLTRVELQAGQRASGWRE